MLDEAALSGLDPSGVGYQIAATIQKALALQEKLTHLRAQSYGSESPLFLLNALTVIVEQITRELLTLTARADTTSPQEVAALHVVLEEVGQRVDPVARSADGALPWGLIYPLELLCRRISQESCIILYPQWEHGYSYAEALGPLRKLAASIPNAATPTYLQGYPRYLALFSYPDAQSWDILENAAWGHEIGHHVDTVFEVSARLFREPIFARRMTASLVATSTEGQAISPAHLHSLQPQFRMLQTWLKELVADLFAVHIFGPASLFAFAQIVPSLEVDRLVERWHPPAWLRVSVMLDELQHLGYDRLLDGAPPTIVSDDTRAVKAAVANRLAALRAESARLAAQPVAHALTAALLADLLAVMPEIAQRVRENTRSAWACEAAAIAPDVFGLVDRLARGLPPSEVDLPGRMVGRATTLAAMVNAGWFYRIWRQLDVLPASLPVTLPAVEAAREALAKLNTLMLKGIELSVAKAQLGRAEPEAADGGAPGRSRLGGVLTRPDLRGALATVGADRLVITPLTDPERQIGSNSIDLKLGCEFLVPRHGRTPYLNLQQDAEAIGASMAAAHERLRLRVGETFILHEHQFVMAETLEYVSLPPHLAGYVLGRSSWERAGLHVRPARIPPGYTGCVQLQLVSHKDLPIQLITGARICQLMLFPVSSPLPDNVSGQVIAAPSFSPILQDEELADLLGGRHHLILGITGTVASGETALAQYFHEEHGYHMLSLATPVYEEARRRGLPITLPNLQDVGNDLRHTYGAGVLVDRLRSEIQRLPRDANLILMAIKNPGEVAALREWQNFRLIAIDAPADRRFAWAQLSDTFGIYGSRQAFDRIDARDCGIDEPPWGQNVTACIAEADYSIQNGANGEMRAKFDACYAWVRKELV